MSRYDLFRRRIAPIAFGVAVALIARDACNKQARTHATLVFDLGAQAASARAFDAELSIGGDTIAQFHRAALASDGLAPQVQFEVSLPGDDAEATIDLDLGARHVRVSRHLHVIEGSTVTISLADAIAAAP